MPNRLANINDTLLGIYIGKDAITWGDNYNSAGTLDVGLWDEECMLFPDGAFFKRENERFVLPHAIGCQSPTNYLDYRSILQG